MKKIYVFAIPFLLIACEGPEGPVGGQGIMGITGTDGIDGIDGINGTNGADGQDGDQGIQGEPGPGTRTVYTGNIISDDMRISVPGLSINDPPSVDVFICPVGFECIALPLTFTFGVIALYSITTNQVHLVNMLSAVTVLTSLGGTYVIVIIE